RIKAAIKDLKSPGYIAFVGTPKVYVIGRDDAALECELVIPVATQGAQIVVTGKASEEYAWACSWTETLINISNNNF
ncbi:unnamed protein product, partial [marine sediment metagenome]